VGVRNVGFSAVALVQSLQQAKQDLDLMIVMTRLDKYQVLVIDDIGYVRKTNAETQVLFELGVDLFGQIRLQRDQRVSF
jgi:DNA replication protein DnaC